MLAQVSVVVPTFNRCEWLAKAVASVRGQTLPAWELVVVNDGSTDGTADLLAELASEDLRVRVLTQKNQGQAYAIRRGVQASDGRLISILSDDDELAPRALETMAAWLGNEPRLDAVYTDYVVEYLDNVFGGTAGEIVRKEADAANALPDHNVVWGCMFRREMCAALGGYPTRFTVAHDWHFWLMAYASGMRLARVPEMLYVYRYHKGGMTFQRRSLQLAEADEIGRLYRDGALDVRV